MDYGEVILFDPRLIHGTSENHENETRVSLDFRILPLESYERIVSQHEGHGIPFPEHCGLPLIRGIFYDERSAYQL